MKYLVLLACMSAFALQAQTTFVKKYHNGMPDTIWHINGLDTFLIESFKLNGHLGSRTWREDSVYHYDNQGNTQNKKIYHKKKWKEPNGTYPYYVNYKKMVDYYPNGKIAKYGAWVNDTFFQLLEYDLKGGIRRQNTIQINPTHILERVFEDSMLKEAVLRDTAKKIEKTWRYSENKLQDFTEISTIKTLDYNNTTTKYIEYGANKQIVFEWAVDSNSLIPFKDNGLCLYGFTNLKSDTIIPARYEDVQTIRNKEVQAYYIVQHGTQYGVLDEFGNLIIPEIWSYLTPFYKRNGYNVSFEQTCRGETFLENTYLEGRQASRTNN